MFNLVIVPNNSANFAVCHFNSGEAAKNAQADIERQRSILENKSTAISIEDDYGAVIFMPAEHISYTALIDLHKKGMAQLENKICDAKINRDFTQRMAGDRELQALTRFMAAQQPQVIQVSSPEQSQKPN